MDKTMHEQSYPVRMVRSVVLPNGSMVVIRPIAAKDAGIEREFIEGLSNRSSNLRFLGAMKNPQDKLIEYFTQIDYQKHMALVATVKTDDEEQQIAVGRYIALDDNESCEFAIAVADRWQHQGIGREIMTDLIKDARSKGLKRMVGTIWATNKNMICFAEQLGFVIHLVKDDRRVVEAELEL